ncbi:carbohydrate kinase family protein [Rubrimonas cliftonensis]|uniref:Fructokinase n=1 Tax=Rubrimonas cliftonensis TaxID=89524 RepID=A0A1H4C0B8_9RHOB|nr:carbohydrate kinase [Rubrimonas cliftonensis]SEA53881.1 fructokinase [Rubrimonas cliftonensis]
MTFLVCGEALYDVFVDAETDSGFALDARVGGSAFNVAIGLARLGQPVAMVTGVATDALGQKLARTLAAEGVDTTHLALKSAKTTLALVTLGGDGGARYAFYADGAADRLVKPEDLPALDDDIRGVLFGCFSLLTQPTGDSFLDYAKQARGGPLVTLDPNIRATVEPDMGRWRSRVEAFAAHADLIKVSLEDLALLYPGVSPAALARRWLTGGARLVVVTRGRQGASAWTDEINVEAAPPRAEVVDTVGAGDSFLAALVTALAEAGLASREGLTGLDAGPLGRAMQFAVQAAALTCEKRGADLPMRAQLPEAPKQPAAPASGPDGAAHSSQN